MLRRFPTGPTMTPDVFMRQAMDRPLSPWATFAGAAAEGLLQSPGLGTAIREGYAPETAKTPEAGGRGGVKWKYDSAQEVEARGDKLFETEDAFKASPMYREEIPFEKGMTESRARALAEMHDASTVRNYYSSKRPVVAFAGTIAGAALDPINYIPIVGEAAMAAAVARTGRIAGRALMGGVDAAANTALFGVLSADTRARLGDDVSWQALASNAAFAAMAGVAIGGAIGGVSKFRGWDADMVKPKVEAPKVDLPNSVTAKPNSVLDTFSSVSGDATARFTPDRAVTITDVVSRMETAGNRIKAADVLNDAVFGMVNDGEVKLGARSQATISDISDAYSERVVQAQADQISADALDALSGLKPAADTAEAAQIIASMPDRFRAALAGKQAAQTNPVAVQAERSIATQARNYIRAEARRIAAPNIQRMEASGTATARFSPQRSAAGDTRAPTVEVGRTEGAITTTGSQPFASGRQEINYSTPAPDLPPANLKTAETKVDARKTLPADPEQAALDRAIADAKEEGFDPETGEHDLEPDVDSLRAQEALTADEEQALAAADETFQAVEAWQKVMAVAQSCVLK